MGRKGDQKFGKKDEKVQRPGRARAGPYGAEQPHEMHTDIKVREGRLFFLHRHFLLPAKGRFIVVKQRSMLRLVNEINQVLLVLG